MNRTDDQGIVTIHPKAGHDYMLDAVILARPTAPASTDTGADWETLWANLVVRIPKE